MKSKFLVVKGCAGLGNRLYSVFNAIEYAKRNNRTLVVDWSDGQYGKKGCNVFWKYFELINIATQEKVTDPSEIGSIYPDSHDLLMADSIYDYYEFAGPLNLPKYLHRITKRSRLSRIWQAWVPIDSSSKHCWKRIYKNDCLEFGGCLKDGLKQDVVVFADYIPVFHPDAINLYLRLKPKILEEVDRLSREMKLTDGAIGIHVRFRDKRPTSDISLIARQIKRYGLEGVPVFLATDSSEIVHALTKQFDQVYTLDKLLPDSNEGLHQWSMKNDEGEYAETILKDSILDMWLLGRCTHLFHQGNSTFSQISRFIHQGDGCVIDWQIPVVET